ncbi:IMS domain-containing protein [Okeania sp.]|uniref:IMS domain-containing protein n=1 Tax=Okeania sp. TaxID=3100323 RepID=UPI002B4AFFED|nr:IMS domain-containing protein [Okeania sp.]MEB3342917.1 IMS domain-containing protein [Okeania sp.]
MRIPLDYYRILGLPIQATAEQLQQAHKDRTQQFPRREYSEATIVARKQLIDEAYAVLSDPEQRQTYDGSFLAKTYEPELEELSPSSNISLDKVEEKNTKLQETREVIPTIASRRLAKRISSQGIESISGSEFDPNTPSIEIENSQFVGAILILQELGEYELVLKLTYPYLNNNSIAIKDGRFGDPALVLPDIVLTVALANLELGREQWQQGQYETAATALEAGQGLLLRENLFVQVRGEIQADLYKLRPYRVIELISLPEEMALERRRGLEILQDMLNERGGIDGQGEDSSGLDVENFLKFVQQLRQHLTTTEQKKLFEVEARRPSAVGTYLAVYTFLAQGFVQKQPALIRKAKLMLMQLGRSQDVNLEKSVCALLLGQTEEASRSLELSQENEPLSFIKENSQESPDLLPGLCLYAEHWLTEEVFPHFRDLSDKSASLKDYFADQHVQAYLEALPTEVEAANQWVVVQPRHDRDTEQLHQKEVEKLTVSNLENKGISGLGSAATASFGSVSQETANLEGTDSEKLVQESEKSSLTGGQKHLTNTSYGRYSARKRERSQSNLPLFNEGKSLGSEQLPQSMSEYNPHRTSTRREPFKVRRLVLIAILGLLSIGIIGWMIIQVLGWLATALGLVRPVSQMEEPMVQLDRPPIEIPELNQVSLEESGTITKEIAQLAIQNWLEIKAAAFGPNHQVEKLPDILVDPALSRWVSTANTLKEEKSYRRYEHDLEVKSVDVNNTNPNQAQVEAEVRERVSFYENDRLTNSNNENLLVRYSLVRQNEKWQISNWKIVR